MHVAGDEWPTMAVCMEQRRVIFSTTEGSSEMLRSEQTLQRHYDALEVPNCFCGESWYIRTSAYAVYAEYCCMFVVASRPRATRFHVVAGARKQPSLPIKNTKSCMLISCLLKGKLIAKVWVLYNLWGCICEIAGHVGKRRLQLVSCITI